MHDEANDVGPGAGSGMGAESGGIVDFPPELEGLRRRSAARRNPPAFYINPLDLSVSDQPHSRECPSPHGGVIDWKWGPGHYTLADTFACDEKGKLFSMADIVSPGAARSPLSDFTTPQPMILLEDAEWQTVLNQEPEPGESFSTFVRRVCTEAGGDADKLPKSQEGWKAYFSLFEEANPDLAPLAHTADGAPVIRPDKQYNVPCPRAAAGTTPMPPAESLLAPTDYARQEEKLDVLKKIIDLLEREKAQMTEEQKKSFEELEKRKIKLMLDKMRGTLDDFEGETEGVKSGSLVTPEDKKRWNTEQNVADLASIIMAESGAATQAEAVAVAYTVLNRMKRNGLDEVAAVKGFARPKSPNPAAVAYARDVLACKLGDNTSGATHFYSPGSMSKDGEQPEGDTGGGLEKVEGVPVRNYRPGWSVSPDFERILIPGIEERRFKFYRRKGTGKVR